MSNESRNDSRGLLAAEERCLTTLQTGREGDHWRTRDAQFNVNFLC